MTRIKICGLMRDCDVDYVNEACHEYVGFVFAHTRREISAETAGRFRRNLRKEIQAVGVFVDEEPERVVWLLQEGIIDIAQLHGRESAAYVEQLKKRTGSMLIKALHPEQITAETDVRQEKDIYADYIRAGVDYFLFDSRSATMVGGTGKTFDWRLIPEGNHPFFLAGGLQTDNIEAALQAVHPYAVDISSGVETDGAKDREKILEIVRRIRNV